VIARACIGEPVSWPRLERYAAGELDATTRGAIDAHLRGCAACRACLDTIRADVVALPPLPVIDVRPPARILAARWLFAGGALAAAAAILLVVLTRGSQPAPRASVAVKGAGVVVLSVVRERDGAIAIDPSTYRANDRLKVQLTCDPGPSVWADVIVYQDDGAAFPIAPAAIPCGNHATVPGAFRISGRGHALVCVALGVAAPPARAAHGPAPGQACIALAPE